MPSPPLSSCFRPSVGLFRESLLISTISNKSLGGKSNQIYNFGALGSKSELIDFRGQNVDVQAHDQSFLIHSFVVKIHSKRVRTISKSSGKRNSTWIRTITTQSESLKHTMDRTALVYKSIADLKLLRRLCASDGTVVSSSWAHIAASAQPSLHINPFNVSCSKLLLVEGRSAILV